MTPLVARFQRTRWSEVRRRIDVMKRGEHAYFRADEKGAVTTAITRTQDAYGTRRYRYGDWLRAMIVVERIR